MHPDWWDIKRSEANAHEVKRCEHVRHTNSNDTANLRIEVPIIKEAWLDFATLFDASDVFTNL